MLSVTNCFHAKVHFGLDVLNLPSELDHGYLACGHGPQVSDQTHFFIVELQKPTFAALRM